VRVAIFTREFLDETRWGGIGTFYRDFASRLIDRGISVEIFTQALASRMVKELGGVKVHGCVPRAYVVGPRRGGPLGGTGPRWLGLFALALAREVALTFGRRSRAVRFDVVESHEHLGIGALLVNALEARALARADLRVAPSDFIARATREQFTRSPPADVRVPLATPLEPVPETATADGEPLAVFVGRLSMRKRPLVAAEAFARAASEIQGWRFEMAGSDDMDPDGRRVSRRCAELLSHIEGRWSYRGPLPAEEVRELFRRAAVVLIPSSFESFGLVAVEAMSQGCVPIVAAGGALEEVVGDAGLTVPLDDAEATARALIRLARQPQERLALARRGLRRVRESFAPGRLLDRNIELYHRRCRNARWTRSVARTNGQCAAKALAVVRAKRGATTTGGQWDKARPR